MFYTKETLMNVTANKESCIWFMSFSLGIISIFYVSVLHRPLSIRLWDIALN